MFEQPLLSFLVWLTVPVLTAFLFGEQVENAYKRPYFVGFGMAIAIVVGLIVSLNWRSLRASIGARLPVGSSLAVGWSLVVIAIALRYGLLELIPPPLPGFEEIQAGGSAIRIARGAELPLMFRFTNVLGGLGFALADNSLEALRAGFRVAGALSIPVMALLLRRMNVAWIPTLLAVFTMATLRWLVIAGGAADELFTGLIFEVLILYCVVGCHTSRANWLTWAGLAGLFGGLLAYEYDSYKIVFALPLAFWLVEALTAAELAYRRRVLQAGGLYVLVFTVMALPVIASVIDNPGGSHFMDGFNRHRMERWALSADVVSYVKSSFGFVLKYGQSLIGQVDDHSNNYYRPPGEPVIPGIAGAMFVLSWLYALWRPANRLVRLSALAVLVMVLGAAFLTNNLNVGRLTPALPLLIMLSAVGADSILRRIQSRDDPNLFRKIQSFAAILIVFIVIGNIAAAVRASSSDPVLKQYANNQYTICRAIADEQRRYQFLYLYAVRECNLGDDLWINPDMTATVESLGALPGESELPPGSLVVIADTHGLAEERIVEMVALAARMNSAHTLRTSETVLGLVATVSFCYQCSPP